MIDEHHEELASLYAFDLLEGQELVQFEAALARDPDLQALVRGLRQTSTKLAYTASATVPPDALRQRVPASIAASPRKVSAVPDNMIRPPFRIWSVVPWAAAACFD